MNSGGANAASGYTLQLTNPLNSTGMYRPSLSCTSSQELTRFVDIYATSEPFEIKAPNSPYPSQDDPASPTISTSGTMDPSTPSSSSSTTAKPNSASPTDLLEARAGVILGFVAFGGMMYLLNDDSMPFTSGHPFAFGP